MLGAVKADAQIATRQVLLLQSFGRGYLVYDSFAGDFRVELDRLAGVPINVVQVVAGPTGSIAAPDSAVLDYVHSNFAGRRAPDLIVTLGGPAAIFAQKYRQQLFPEAPLVFASVYQKFLVDVPLADNETAVAVNNDLATPIEDMLHVLPETRDYLAEQALEMLRRARFWFTQLTLIHALCLWEMPEPSMSRDATWRFGPPRSERSAASTHGSALPATTSTSVGRSRIVVGRSASAPPPWSGITGATR